MHTIELEHLCSVCGGDGETVTATDPGPVRDENTGKCGPGPYSWGQTEACRRHDDCVGKVGQYVGTPLAHVVCSPLLVPAAKSAIKCAMDPLCPK